MKFIIFVYISMFTCNFLYPQVQQGWFLLSPRPNENEIVRSCCFVDRNTITLTGSFSGLQNNYTILYRSSNAGSNWYNPDYMYVLSIYFLNSTTGFGNTGLGIMKTTDGGQRWVSKGGGQASAISFYNDTLGYAVTISENGPKVLRTTNTGENWQYLNSNIPGSYRLIRDIKFFNESTGICCGDMNYFLRSTDGGINWTFVIAPDYGILFSICILNNSTGFVSGNNNNLFKTTNAGQNWISVYNGSNMSFERIEFFDENTGYTASSYGDIEKTTNGGVNWQTILADTSYVLNQNKFHFFDKNEGYIMKNNGHVFKTTNGGTNWVFPLPDDNLNCIFMLNDSVGFLGGTRGDLYKMSNALSRWYLVSKTKISGFNGSKINDIYFINSAKGVVVSDSGKIFITADSSKTWSSVQITSLRSLKKICFLNPNTGFIVGEHGTCLKTIDSGSNWFSVASGTSVDINWICKSDSGYVYACCDSSVVLKSTNYGSNWSSFNVPEMCNLNSLAFRNDYVGVAVGNNGFVFQTTNGGYVWQRHNVGTSENMNSVQWFNDSCICIAGNKGVIKMSTNNGRNWGMPYSPYFLVYDFRSVAFINNSTGFICGSADCLLRTTDCGGPLIGITKNEIEITEAYDLIENFPNPFNSITTVRYHVPQSGVFKISISDILGREVSVPVDGFKKSGKYMFKFDGSRFSSGIYFCKYQSENFVITKRMVLLK